MTARLALSIGQHSDKGRKETNQDFHGALIPEQPALGTKGIAIALADGLSSSSDSRVAAESAISNPLSIKTPRFGNFHCRQTLMRERGHSIVSTSLNRV